MLYSCGVGVKSLLGFFHVRINDFTVFFDPYEMNLVGNHLDARSMLLPSFTTPEEHWGRMFYILRSELLVTIQFRVAFLR